MCHPLDSHVFVEHPSMMDFEALFVSPVMFDWVEGRCGARRGGGEDDQGGQNRKDEILDRAISILKKR